MFLCLGFWSTVYMKGRRVAFRHLHFLSGLHAVLSELFRWIAETSTLSETLVRQLYLFVFPPSSQMLLCSRDVMAFWFRVLKVNSSSVVCFMYCGCLKYWAAMMLIAALINNLFAVLCSYNSPYFCSTLSKHRSQWVYFMDSVKRTPIFSMPIDSTPR